MAQKNKQLVYQLTLLGKKLAYRAFEEDLYFYCVACDTLHSVTLAPHAHYFNGNLEYPTIRPRVNLKYGACEEERQQCHFTLISGELKYFSNCTHEYAGKTIALPEIPQHIIESFEILLSGEAE